MAPWWSRWLTRDGDDEKDTPTSHIDSLVVQGGQRRAEMARKTHQRVMLTRWWSRQSTRDGEDENEPPRSHTDSLVV